SLLDALGKFVTTGGDQWAALSVEVDLKSRLDPPLSRNSATRVLSGLTQVIGSSGRNFPLLRISTTGTTRQSSSALIPPMSIETLNRASRRVIIQSPLGSISGAKLLIALS